MVEHATENRSVGGSIPPLGTSFTRWPDQLSPYGHVWLSCETEDLAEALAARQRLNAETEIFWSNLAAGRSGNAHARYEAAVLRARMEGFVYRPVPQLAEDASTSELLARTDRLEEMLRAGTGDRHCLITVG